MLRKDLTLCLLDARQRDRITRCSSRAASEVMSLYKVKRFRKI